MVTAIDIGATKTLVAQFDSGGSIKSRVKFPTSKDQDEFYQELIDTLTKLTRPTQLVVAVPGITDNLGVIRRCGVLPWEDFDLKGQLEQKFACRVLIENDSKLACLAEANAISPLPELCMYITVSTGIGDGVARNGKLVEALKYSEAGHMIVWNEGKWQTWQDIASGKSILEHFGKMARDLYEPEQWQWVSEKLSLGLAALIPTVQPDVIVFGGSVGEYFERYGTQLQEVIEKRLPKFIKRPKLVKAKHPEEAVIYGCYYYAKHQQDAY